MTLTIFKSRLLSEKGAAEFIEGSLVLSFILTMISLLLIISMTTIYTIRDGELVYIKALDQIYQNQENIYLKDLKDREVMEILSTRKVFATESQVKTGKKANMKLSRLNTESILRKVDLADEILEQINSGELLSLEAKINQYKKTFDNFMGIK